jgi:hypothetical protein
MYALARPAGRVRYAGRRDHDQPSEASLTERLNNTSIHKPGQRLNADKASGADPRALNTFRWTRRHPEEALANAHRDPQISALLFMLSDAVDQYERFKQLFRRVVQHVQRNTHPEDEETAKIVRALRAKQRELEQQFIRVFNAITEFSRTGGE